MQGKSVCFRQGVPELLEPDRCVSFTFRPQESHHFSECRDARALVASSLSRTLDDLSDNAGETLGIRLAGNHKFRERFSRIQSQVPSLSYRHAHIQAMGC